MCAVPSCPRPAAGGTICHQCTTQLVVDLRDLARGRTTARTATDAHRDGYVRAGLLRDLQTVVTRSARHGSGGPSFRRPSEPPLPFHIAAASIMDRARAEITAWALDFAALHPHLTLTATTLAEACEWMTCSHALLRQHPAAGELATAMRRLAEDVRSMVDAAPDRTYLGPCHTPDADGGECMAELFAAEDATTATCTACGAEHVVAHRRDWIRYRVRSATATARQISDAARCFYGARLSVKTIRTWARREQIPTVKLDDDGTPLHLVGAVLTYAASRHAQQHEGGELSTACG